MPFCWTSLFLPSDYATRPNPPLIRSTTRVFSRFVSSHGSRRGSPAFKTAIASPITAFSRRSAAICRFSPIGSSHPVVHHRNPYAVAHVHESADSFPFVCIGPLPHARRRAANVLGDVAATLPGDDASGGPGLDVKRIRKTTATMSRIPGYPVRQVPLRWVPQLGDHLLQRHAFPEVHVDGFLPLLLAEHSGLQSGHSRVQLFVRIPAA